MNEDDLSKVRSLAGLRYYTAVYPRAIVFTK